MSRKIFFTPCGEFNAFAQEAEDGYDAQEWAGKQPWSSGKVGTIGGSYVGFTQWAAATLAGVLPSGCRSLPPASRRQMRIAGSSERRPASTQPAVPAPTIT